MNSSTKHDYRQISKKSEEIYKGEMNTIISDPTQSMQNHLMHAFWTPVTVLLKNKSTP